MTQMNGTITFETRKLEEAITAAVEARLAETVAQVVLPGLAQVLADVQRLTKLLETEAVGLDEFASVLAHSGAVNLEVARAQASSLTHLGYRLVPIPETSAPAPVAATWDGPTPPQAAQVVHKMVTGETPLWTPPETRPAMLAEPSGRDMSLAAIIARGDGVGDVPPAERGQDKTWTEAFE